MPGLIRDRWVIDTRRAIGALFDAHLPHRKLSYALQSAMATLAMLFVLLVEDVALRAAIVVSMASTIFIILWSRTALRPRLGRSSEATWREWWRRRSSP